MMLNRTRTVICQLLIVLCVVVATLAVEDGIEALRKNAAGKFLNIANTVYCVVSSP